MWYISIIQYVSVTTWFWNQQNENRCNLPRDASLSISAHNQPFDLMRDAAWKSNSAFGVSFTQMIFCTLFMWWSEMYCRSLYVVATKPKLPVFQTFRNTSTPDRPPPPSNAALCILLFYFPKGTLDAHLRVSSLLKSYFSSYDCHKSTSPTLSFTFCKQLNPSHMQQNTDFSWAKGL